MHIHIHKPFIHKIKMNTVFKKIIFAFFMCMFCLVRHCVLTMTVNHFSKQKPKAILISQDNEHLILQLKEKSALPTCGCNTLLPVHLLGVKLSSLLGKKGNLEKLQSYWEVGFFLGASVLANDHLRVIQASEKLFKLKTPAW